MKRRKTKASILENLVGLLFAAGGVAILLALLWLNREHVIAAVMPGAGGETPLPQPEPVQAQVVDGAVLQRTLDDISARKRAEEEARLQAIRDAEEAKRRAEEAQRQAEEKARREAEAAKKAAEEAKRAAEAAAAEKAAAEKAKAQAEKEQKAAEAKAQEAAKQAAKDKAAKEKAEKQAAAEKAAKEKAEKQAAKEKAEKEKAEKQAAAEKKAAEEAAARKAAEEKAAKEKAAAEAKAAKEAKLKAEREAAAKALAASLSAEADARDAAAGQAAIANAIGDFGAAMQKKMTGLWQLPANIPPNLSAQLYVRFDSHGNVTSVDVKRSSGYPLFDDAAKQTALRASPLPMPKNAEAARQVASEGLLVNFSP